MGIADFVDENRKKFWDTRQAEIQPLLNSKTGFIKSELLNDAFCCVCAPKQPDAELAFRKNGFQFVKCTSCGLLYVSPQINEKLLHELYYESKSMDYWMKVQLGEKEQLWNEKSKYRPGLDFLDSICPDKGKLLDIGSSTGQFLLLAQQRGWDVSGIELNESASSYCIKELNLRVENRLLEDIVYPDNSFDCITLWGVVEHLSDPNSMLKEVHRILKPGGKLLAFVPNAHSLVIRITQEKNSTVSGREHLWYFSPKTISKLFIKNDFSIIENITILPQLHEIVHYLQYNLLYNESGFNGEEELGIPPLLYEQIEQFLIDNKMGYKMISVVEKV